jgi:hypothetical protein
MLAITAAMSAAKMRVFILDTSGGSWHRMTTERIAAKPLDDGIALYQRTIALSASLHIA